MKFCNIPTVLAICLLAAPASLLALKSDRQEPLEIKADNSDGTFGDGTATLRGQVEIRQGSLLVQADVANVEKTEGRVTRIELVGGPVHLEQEIESEGLVVAKAKTIRYEVATGIVTLSGAADVVHPQYHISGETLVYDMNAQHFQGSSGEQEGRLQIRLDPELLPVNQPGDKPATGPESADESSGQAPEEPAAEPVGENSNDNSGNNRGAKG